MKQRVIDDLHSQACEIVTACNKLAEINQLNQRFKSGEPLRMTLQLGEIELTERVFLSNGKACFAEDLCGMFEIGLRKTIDKAICSMQTFLEAESAE